VRVANKLKDELNGQLEITRDAGAGTFEVLVGEKTVWTITEKRPFPKLKAKDMGRGIGEKGLVSVFFW